MNTSTTFFLFVLVLATGCGANGETRESPPTAPEGKPASSKHWIDSSTVNAIPAEARGKVLAASESVPTDGESFVALANKLGSNDAAERQASARAVSLTMQGAKGAYLQALDMQVPRYLRTHTKEFLDLFNGTRNMGKTELAAWAAALRGRSVDVPYAATEVLSDMKRNCGDCDAARSEVLDYFMGMVQGEGGKKGELK